MLAAAAAASTGLLGAAPAHAELVGALSQGGDIRLVRPLGQGLRSSAGTRLPQLPAGVNTRDFETLTSLTDGPGFLTFARSLGSRLSTARPFVADLRRGTVAEPLPPAPTDPALVADRFALSPDGRRGAFFYGHRDGSARHALEAIVVDTTATKTGPFPVLARHRTAELRTVSGGRKIIDAAITNDGAVTWEAAQLEAGLSQFPFAAGPALPAMQLEATLGTFVQESMRAVPGFGSSVLGHANVAFTSSGTPPNEPTSRLVSETTTPPLRLRRLLLPNVDLDTAGRSQQLVASGDSGRYLSWTETTLGAQSGALRLFVYDTQTQSLLLSGGRDVGGGRADTYVLAQTSGPVVTAFSVPSTVRVGSASRPVLRPRLSTRASVGILVHKVTGRTNLLGRRVDRLRLVGRVPLGTQRAGRPAIRWDGRVGGKPLARGTYRITLRVLQKGKVVELSAPRTLRVR